MEKPLKLYIDTSVWNFALEIERPDCLLTNEFLQTIKSNEYSIFISDIVLSEILNAYEARRSKLQELLSIHGYEILNVDDSTRELANIYIKEGLIPKNEINDAQHIAIATVYRCNLLVSWNFKHMVKAKVIMGVHHINHREGFGLIDIVSPEHFLGKKE